MAAFVDAEHALDPAYAKKLGVDIDNLLISQPDYGEQALEITEALVRSGAIDVLVVDSVAALVPKAELDGEMGDSHMGLQARLMSQALRKLTGTVSKSRTCLIFINQIREKIGVMFGNPETTTGGRALKFYSSVRIDIRRIAAVKDGDTVVGSRTKVRHLARRRCAGSGGGQQRRREVRRVVQLLRRAHRAGPRERPAVSEGQSRHLRPHPSAIAAEAGNRRGERSRSASGTGERCGSRRGGGAARLAPTSVDWVGLNQRRPQGRLSLRQFDVARSSFSTVAQ
jgi:hypothetical protein